MDLHTGNILNRHDGFFIKWRQGTPRSCSYVRCAHLISANGNKSIVAASRNMQCNFIIEHQLTRTCHRSSAPLLPAKVCSCGLYEFSSQLWPCLYAYLLDLFCPDRGMSVSQRLPSSKLFLRYWIVTCRVPHHLSVFSGVFLRPVNLNYASHATTSVACLSPFASDTDRRTTP